VALTKLMRAVPWPAEAALAGLLYLAGELARGLAAGDATVAERHADGIVRFERRLHVFAEPAIQRATEHVHGLPALLGFSYLTLHLAVTAAVLVWVYRRHRHAYARLRNTLALASALAVVVYALFPAAPPRLAGLQMGDTVSRATPVDLGSSLVSSFYNPYAAVPSMHIGFALIAAAAVFTLARRRVLRLAALAYPVLVLLVIVATGNHFFFDAAAGAAVAAFAFAATARRTAPARVRITAPAKA
jgi:hypothetical protein